MFSQWNIPESTLPKNAPEVNPPVAEIQNET